MFASTLVIETPPLDWQGVPEAVQTWLLAAGGFAFLAVLVWLLSRLLRLAEHPLDLLLRRRQLLQKAADEVTRPPAMPRSGRPWWFWLAGSVVGGLAVALVVIALPLVWYACGWAGQQTRAQARIAFNQQLSIVHLYWVAAACLMACLLPVLVHLGRLSGRRIWALARLGIKEALRSRILWAFSGLLLVFLFASWFLPYEPQYQVRGYVNVVFFVMTVLLLITAGLLAAFSIPADLRRQTMHTVVTKPVERFEIVLGRFIGFLLLMTGILAVMTLFSLVYVHREIDEEARAESLKARVPLFGDLQVIGGVSVGREWKYRQYITGGVTSQRAVWNFRDLPGNLGDRDAIPCEFTFDVFRTLKDRPGQEGKGVYATFSFQNSRWKPESRNAYHQAWVEGRKKGTPETALDNDLAQQFGYFEAPSVKVEDYHTGAITVPGALFRDLPAPRAGQPERPPLQVVVRFESPQQYLGVAQHDLYLLDAERSFDINFLKGALGIWFRMCLVIGVAVTCSTYVSGVISFLSTMFLYVAGMFIPFIKQIADRKVIGGGPMESLIRLSQNEVATKELDRTTTLVVAEFLDRVFSFILHPFLYFVPDVSRFGLTDYVANGFDIPAGKLLVDNALPLAGYLLPWAVLAYFLMRSREIASQ